MWKSGLWISTFPHAVLFVRREGCVAPLGSPGGLLFALLMVIADDDLAS